MSAQRTMPLAGAAAAAVLRSSWVQMRKSGALVVVGLALVLLAALWEATQGGTISLADATPRHQRAITFVVGIGAFLAWVLMLASVLRQNDPQLARLVPGHVRALRAVAIGTAAVLAGSVATIAGVAGAPPLSAAVTWLVLSAFAAAFLRTPPLFLAPMLLYLLLPDAASREALLLFMAIWDAQPWWLAVVGAAAVAWMSTTVLHGGERHRRSQPARLGWSSPFAWSSSPGSAAATGEAGIAWSAWLLWLDPGRPLYFACLRRRLRRVEGSVDARLLLGLGPVAHWGSMTGQILFAALLALLLSRSEWSAAASTVARDAAVGSAFMIVAMVLLISAFANSIAMWQTRREQALLRLLPGVPKGKRLNGWLAMRFARQRIALAVACLAVMLAANGSGRVDAAGSVQLDFALCAVALSPLFVLSLWRDWSAAEPPAAFVAPSDVVVFLYVVGMCAWWTAFGDGPWWVLAASSTIALVPCALLRWRSMRSAPPAWPVGRR